MTNLTRDRILFGAWLGLLILSIVLKSQTGNTFFFILILIAGFAMTAKEVFFPTVYENDEDKEDEN